MALPRCTYSLYLLYVFRINNSSHFSGIVSKSMTVTESFPSWFIGKNPERRVIEVSYGDALARRFGRANRRKIESF